MESHARSKVYQTLFQDNERLTELAAKTIFADLVQESQYVGDVYSLGYESALVLIHDFHRKKVGGIPSLSFLIATRISPQQLDNEHTGGDYALDYKAEDTSIVLLRVMDAAPLPNDAEALRVRVETAQRVSGETGTHWDGSQSMDASTANLLSFAGVKCRVIGTFFLDTAPEGSADSLQLRFGSDISNYYPNRGLKVYKPNGDALKRIVNYRDPDRSDQRTQQSVMVGDVRYASTNRSFQGISNVPVDIMPADLLGQKTALFGMTRTGKSNTTKIILKSVFDLRFHDINPLRIGQIVFDPNGEYANENTQDMSMQQNPSAIKNVWRVNGAGKQDDVVTYGITPHPDDPGRKLMLLNFFAEDNLQLGKDIINGVLADDSAKFIANFRQVMFERPPESDKGLVIRYKRRALVYRTLLVKAGFTPPTSVVADTTGLFGQDLLTAMQGTGQAPDYQNAARTLGTARPSWSALSTAFTYLNQFISDPNSTYQSFNQQYVNRPGSSGEAWADDDLLKLLEMFKYANGSRQIGKARPQHTHQTDTDYAEDIYKDLVAGRLVIVDQSSGDPELNSFSAQRIMWYIFRKNQEHFRTGKTPPDILVYIEEAHNLLPAGADMDLKDVWVRTAKEGAKYHIGLVYATQEVSSIQRNILKNTANWFIGHLNNTDETKELRKYYDFADFEQSILRAQDRGFVRVKTLSNLFIVPIQVRKFEV
jgi:hypothetical protein